MLEAECAAANVQILTHCDIDEINCDKRYSAITNKGTFTGDSLVIATGGLSIPKMGASDFGYRIANQFGLAVRDITAGLVPFTFSGAMQDLTSRLSGISLPATVQAAETVFAESILFTHRGMSGPAALQASNYWRPGSDIIINLLPAIDVEEQLRDAKTTHPKLLLRTLLSELLPRALVLELQELLWPGQAETPIGEIADKTLAGIAEQLTAWHLRPSGTEGYRTAEVTLGGIDTNELSSKTMECKRQPGLYCVGEVVDVTGHLGGFNFQWAWASGHAAGQVA